MIFHAAEVWAALAVCFVLGALVGSLLHRTVALTGARRVQANLVHAIDGIVRAVERALMPWRGSVPAVLPQTVPIPPPDFRHVVEVPEVAVPVEPDRHWEGMPAAAAVPSETALALPAQGQAVPPPSDEVVVADPAVGFQPLPLPAPRNGVADPLHLIHGLTRRHAGRLARVGIFHFSQIASWTPQEVAWVATYLGAGDAIAGKDWVGQAMHFASSDEPIREPEPKPARAATAKKGARKPPAKRAAGKVAAEVGTQTPSDASADPAEAKAGKRKRTPAAKNEGRKRTPSKSTPGQQEEGSAAPDRESEGSIAGDAPLDRDAAGQPAAPSED
ncbi:MAG: hypothetical protein ABS35_22065 [Kaistia sp. SCN 65-12]|nr:MAG: hypothetical protein ABS35_22065 [Kaistia sp. SCN 65-12]